MFITTLAKAPEERVHLGIDYSRWLGASKLVTVDGALSTDVPPSERDLTPLRIWAIFIDPNGKAVHLFVERGTDGADYSVVLEAKSASLQIRLDDLVVRVEAPY
jgi:hypothetical protein